jgi:hypothetical protein
MASTVSSFINLHNSGKNFNRLVKKRAMSKAATRLNTPNKLSECNTPVGELLQSEISQTRTQIHQTSTISPKDEEPPFAQISETDSQASFQKKSLGQLQTKYYIADSKYMEEEGVMGVKGK